MTELVAGFDSHTAIEPLSHDTGKLAVSDENSRASRYVVRRYDDEENAKARPSAKESKAAKTKNVEVSDDSSKAEDVGVASNSRYVVSRYAENAAKTPQPNSASAGSNNRRRRSPRSSTDSAVKPTTNSATPAARQDGGRTTPTAASTRTPVTRSMTARQRDAVTSTQEKKGERGTRSSAESEAPRSSPNPATPTSRPAPTAASSDSRRSAYNGVDLSEFSSGRTFDHVAPHSVLVSGIPLGSSTKEAEALLAPLLTSGGAVTLIPGSKTVLVVLTSRMHAAKALRFTELDPSLYIESATEIPEVVAAARAALGDTEVNIPARRKSDIAMLSRNLKHYLPGESRSDQKNTSQSPANGSGVRKSSPRNTVGGKVATRTHADASTGVDSAAVGISEELGRMSLAADSPNNKENGRQAAEGGRNTRHSSNSTSNIVEHAASKPISSSAGMTLQQEILLESGRGGPSYDDVAPNSIIVIGFSPSDPLARRRQLLEPLLVNGGAVNWVQEENTALVVLMSEEHVQAAVACEDIVAELIVWNAVDPDFAEQYREIFASREISVPGK